MSMVSRRDLLYGDICDGSKSNDKNSGNVFLAIELCPHNIMETYVMVLNAITKFSEIFAAIELCQQITGPFAMNSHAIVVKPLLPIIVIIAYDHISNIIHVVVSDIHLDLHYFKHINVSMH